MGNDNPPSNRDNMPYVNGGAVLFALVVLAVLTFAGLYANSALGFATIPPVFVFLVVLFMGWSNNRASTGGRDEEGNDGLPSDGLLGDGTRRRPSPNPPLRAKGLLPRRAFHNNRLLLRLPRKGGSEEERFNRLVHTIKSGGEIKNEGKGRKNTNG